jgi:hypothetical protein
MIRRTILVKSWQCGPSAESLEEVFKHNTRLL